VPALRIIGNLVTGDDLQTQIVLNLSALSVLASLLNSAEKKDIIKETCWALSNITAGNTSQIQAVIEANIFPRLVALLGQADRDREATLHAAWAVSNATSSGTPEQIWYLAEEAGCLRPLCALLACGDDEIVAVVLEALGSILRAGALDAGGSGDRYVVYIKELRVLDRIMQLLAHRDNHIRDKASRLLSVIHICSCTSDNDDVNAMESDTGKPAASSQQAASNVFSFGSAFRAALP
jgi:hypothetical protein